MKKYVYTTVLHIVFDLYGKESKANVYGNDMFIQLFYILYLIYVDIYGKESKSNVYGNDMFIQLFYTLYLIYMKKKVKKMFMERICLYNCFIRCI